MRAVLTVARPALGLSQRRALSISSRRLIDWNHRPDVPPSEAKPLGTETEDPFRQTEDLLAQLARAAPRDESGVAPPEPDSDGGVSRDMVKEAESSTQAWLQSVLQLREDGPAEDATARPTAPSPERKLAGQKHPIGDKLSPAASWAVPVRKSKGPASRRARSLGQTPNEAMTINEIMQELMDDLGEKGLFRPGTSFSTDPYDPASSRSGGGPWTFGPRMAGKRLLEREDLEEDQKLLEEVDALKEEMSCIFTDVELVEWAKKHIFKPITSADGTVSYPRSYPKILAHLLKAVRSNYHNPHLALALFHYAQTVSVESYLSGCLAPAYNELLRTRWDSFRDLEGVEAGVREMEVNGVGWDRGTQRVVSRVVEEVGRQVLDAKGVQIWGKGVYERLSRLEQRVMKDIDDQEAVYEFKQKEKRFAREQDRRRFSENGDGDRNRTFARY